ncbi:MAG: phosphoenolpyruvate synthase [Deltaproteobacteria bacterium]|nr:phosphoenolpyruvate synthase [Deltaproteobacteria bacterium]
MMTKFNLFPKWKARSKGPTKDRLALLFRYKYSSFKMLLDSNSQFLKVITDLEEMLRGQRIFGMSYVKTQADRAVFHALRMVKNLDDLSNHQYGKLFEVVEDIKVKIHAELEQKKELPPVESTLTYSQINKEMVDWVGGKNANLGEIHSQLHLPVPEGFAITTRSFEIFLSHNELFNKINTIKVEIDPNDPESISRASKEIQQLILSSPVPNELEQEIQSAYAQMTQRIEEGGSTDSSPKVALRSSAIGEDSELSFAGQYLSVLNVSSDHLIENYKKVVASLYTPRAMAYRLNKGIRDEDIAMSVACLQMINSKSSGVIYTHHPFNILEDHITLTAVWGLGPYAVEGRITPDSYTVAKDGSLNIMVTAISHKPVQLINDPQGGIREIPVPLEDQDIPCLSPDQISTLAGYALKLEDHFKSPQDIEWALDETGHLLVLQSRPLQVHSPETGLESIPMIPNYPLLIEDGAVAFPGIGFGPAFQIQSDEDLLNFPEGAILVAKHSSPKFVIVMKKARAILTDLGSVTGHMASLAREFAVPTILDTRQATSTIPSGMEITVDAYSGRVYQGNVPELSAFQNTSESPMKGTPVYQILRHVADWIVPLSLMDPKAANFAPEFCRTLHDVGRLVHERSYSEMFQLSDLVSGKEGFAFKLEARIPLDLYVIDLGEGLNTAKAQEVLKKVSIDDIASVPFKALLRGMTHEVFQRPQIRPVSLGGFFSVMREQMLAPPQAGNERFGEKSYAIISDKYLNFSSRVGYHYSILDSYCGPIDNMNYITFSFKGGAADDTRRNRRVRAIGLILKALDFVVNVNGDRVDARFQKYESSLIEEKLDQLGRLLLYTRQMDMLMHSETSVEALAKNFLEGNYCLSCS